MSVAILSLRRGSFLIESARHRYSETDVGFLNSLIFNTYSGYTEALFRELKQGIGKDAG